MPKGKPQMGNKIKYQEIPKNSAFKIIKIMYSATNIFIEELHT